MIYPSHGGQNRGEERVDGGNGAELNSFPIRIYVLQPREGTKAMKKRRRHEKPIVLHDRISSGGAFSGAA